MKLMTFGIYDVKAEAFEHFYDERTYGLAERMFTELIRNPETKFGKWPDDYELHQTGNRDYKTGEVEDVPNQLVISGKSAKVAVHDAP